MLYRIYTEDKGQDKIEEIVTKEFPGFTILKGQGYWKLQKENTLIIEVVTEDNPEDRERIFKVAKAIKLANSQESILIQELKNTQVFV